MHRLQQKNVTLDIEPLLMQLCKINKNANIHLRHEPITKKQFLVSTKKRENIIFLNRSYFENASSGLGSTDSIDGEILNLYDRQERNKNCRLFQFNGNWKTNKHSSMLDFCFRSALSSTRPFVQILVDNSNEIEKLASSSLLKKYQAQYPEVKVEYLLSKKIDHLNKHNFKTLVYFGDFRGSAVSKTLQQKWFSIAEQSVLFSGPTLLYVASETKRGLLNLEEYFSNLENLTIIFDYLGEKNTSTALQQAIAAIKQENKEILDNPLDVHRCGELISYALEDGSSLSIKNKGHQVKYGTII